MMLLVSGTTRTISRLIATGWDGTLQRNWLGGTWLRWVVVGGESGHRARPMHPAWARSLRDQCQLAGAAYFFKQWGEWSPPTADTPNGVKLAYVDRAGGATPAASPFEHGCPCCHAPSETAVVRVGKKAAGRLLDGRTWDEFPEVAHA